MRAVRRAGTKAELLVADALRRRRYKVLLNVAELPGSPDVVLPRKRICIFVHGCFWHRHPGCRRASVPKGNREYWRDKFEANVRRDRRKARALRALGWRVRTIWECQVTDPASIRARLRLGMPRRRDDAG
jgi:DNA mismatch endonuclease (patch repair protein)